MKKIRYQGTLPSIEIDLAGRTVMAARGQPVEVPEPIAEELLQREDFTEIGTDVVNVPFTPPTSNLTPPT